MDDRVVLLSDAEPTAIAVDGADATAVLTTYAGPFDRRLLEQLPQCQVIARYGIGVDTIDLEAATDLGIVVTNNPTYCVEEVAEHTIALLVSA